MALSKSDILNAQDLPFDVVPVPEWGGEVRLRSLTARERDEYEAGLVSNKGKDRSVNFANARARLAALVIVDSDGKAMFDIGDVALLGRKSAKALDRVFEKAQAMNGFKEEDVEELVGNSAGGPHGDSR